MVISAPPVKRLINRFESKTNLVFKPHISFYDSLGIRRKRFGQLVRGEKNPDSEEIKRLLEYFKQFFEVKVDEMFND